MLIHPKVPEFILIRLLQTSGTLTFSLHWWPVTWCAPRCFEAVPVVRLQWGGHNVRPQRSQRWASLFITYGYLWWIYYDNLWHSCIYPRYLQLHGWNRMSYYMNFRNPLGIGGANSFGCSSFMFFRCFCVTNKISQEKYRISMNIWRLWRLHAPKCDQNICLLKNLTPEKIAESSALQTWFNLADVWCLLILMEPSHGTSPNYVLKNEDCIIHCQFRLPKGKLFLTTRVVKPQLSLRWHQACTPRLDLSTARRGVGLLSPHPKVSRPLLAWWPVGTSFPIQFVVPTTFKCLQELCTCNQWVPLQNECTRNTCLATYSENYFSIESGDKVQHNIKSQHKIR